MMLFVIITAGLAGIVSVESTENRAAATCNEDPPHIRHGRAIVSTRTQGSLVHYVCDDSYMEVGKSRVQCDEGEWRGFVPRCIDSKCYLKDLEKAENIAPVTPDITLSGDHLNVTCEEGYTTRLVIPICLHGKWNRNFISPCTESQCSKHKLNFAGLRKGNQAWYDDGHAFQIACEPRYRINEEAELRCSEGEWKTNVPPCVPAGCLTSKFDFSGFRRGHKFLYRDGHLSAQILCEAGYQINDEAEVKCLKGEWTANVPPCTPVDCAEPPTIPYANLEKTSTTHGSYAIYAFQDPYKLIGHVKVQCLFGEWISTPRCLDGQCSKDKLNFAGLRKGNQAWYDDGHAFQIACEPRYRINEEAELRCSEGEWKTNVPPCVPADCEEPPAAPFTKVEKESTSHGSYANYTCQEPYKLIGNPQVQCWYGEWKNPPRCDDGRCDINDLRQTSHISREETPRFTNSGQRLDVACKAGFTPRYVTATPYCLNGKWMWNDRSPCIENDCLVPEIKHGYIFKKVNRGRHWHVWKGYVDDIEEETVIYGTLVEPSTQYHLRCDSGYSFQGASETERRITCTKGNWIPTPVCIPHFEIQCPLLEDNTNRRIFNIQYESNRRVHSVAKYACKSRTQKLLGTSSRECLPNGQWSGSNPSCEDITCERILTYNSLVVAYTDGNKMNSVATFRCGPNAKLIGKNSTICMHNGQWSNPKPMCENNVTAPVPQEVTCEKPLPPERGSVQFSHGQAVGSLAAYLCEEGATLVGVSLSKCLETGNWTFDAPKCLRSCIIPEIENGVNVIQGRHRRKFHSKHWRYPRIHREFGEVGETVNHGVSVTLRCLNGSIPVSVTTLRNGDTDVVSCFDGVWSKLMQCAPSKCLEDPPHMENSYPVEKNNTNGSVIWYKCERGFEEVKAGYAECVYGAWKEYPSVCEDISMCSIENLLLFLPANVLPDLRNLTGGDYVPYGTEIQFLCDSNSFVSGSQKAKCEPGGWKFGVVRCIQRCVLEGISPQLLVEPIKEHYLFGESVKFSCLRGQKLSSEVRRVMCLGTSWSDPIPDCVEAIYWGK